jgi:hypothetical protein
MNILEQNFDITELKLEEIFSGSNASYDGKVYPLDHMLWVFEKLGFIHKDVTINSKNLSKQLTYLRHNYTAVEEFRVKSILYGREESFIGLPDIIEKGPDFLQNKSLYRTIKDIENF